MLTHPTINQLHQLGLAGMARAFIELQANPTSAELSHAEWLGLLLDREATERYDRRLRARSRFARLHHQVGTNACPIPSSHKTFGFRVVTSAIKSGESAMHFTITSKTGAFEK